jgi:hypothetical protein
LKMLYLKTIIPTSAGADKIMASATISPRPATQVGPTESQI